MLVLPHLLAALQGAQLLQQQPLQPVLRLRSLWLSHLMLLQQGAPLQVPLLLLLPQQVLQLEPPMLLSLLSVQLVLPPGTWVFLEVGRACHAWAAAGVRAGW